MEKVTSPDGTKGFYDESTGFIPVDSMLKVTSPDGVRGYYHDSAGFIPEPSANPTSSPGFLGNAWNKAKQFMGGMQEGAANVLGTPVDLLEMGLQALPKSLGVASSKPVGGSQWLKENVFTPFPKEDGFWNNVLRASGEQVAGVMPGVGMAAKAGAAWPAFKEGMKIAATAGPLSGTARTYAPDSPMADLAAQVAGGLAPSLPRMGRSIITNLVSPNVEEKMLQKANKFSTALSGEERSSRLNTQLNEGIKTTPQGLEKSKNTIRGINQEIQDHINGLNSDGVMINTQDTLQPVRELMAQVGQKNALPLEAQTQIGKVIDEFESSHPTEISIRQAQDFKQSLNKELDDFYKAANSSPDKTTYLANQWTNKAKARLADGLRSAITSEYPEISGLNAREGALIQLNKSLERSVNRIANRDPLRLKTIVAFLASPKHAVAEILLNNPNLKSSLAVALRQARQKAGRGIMAP